MKVFLVSTIAVVLAASLCSVGHAEDGEGYWNQFRGPNGDGKTSAKKIPIEFGETQYGFPKNVTWRTAIPGRGYSSPVIWDDQVWLTTAPVEGKELFAVAVDLQSGEIIHHIKVFDFISNSTQNPSARRNSHASPTPVVEEGRVYVHFGRNGTACLDTNTGEKIWERRDFECNHGVRPGSSPIIYGDSLFVAFDGVDAQYIVALDKNTGETLWRRDRNVEIGDREPDYFKGFSTATIIEYEGRRQLISDAASTAISYDPETGEEFWRVRHGGINAAGRPVFENGLLYFRGDAENTLHAIRPSGSGDVTDTHIVWGTTKGRPDFPSYLVVDDLLFVVNSGGVASCLEAKTGRELWKERLGGHYYWASPLYAGGNVYFFSKEGIVSVIAASREFEVVGENSFEEGFHASPAVAGNALILRSATHLYRVEEE
jgi:outer membrane protein assembly factor BamB